MSTYLLALSVNSALAGDPAADQAAFPYPIETRTLANGLTAHVVPMPSPGVAAVYVWMTVGSRDEIDAGRTGFAHFFEHLFFYGTPTLGGKDREQVLVRLGADENAYTWNDETVYHAVIAADRVDEYLAIQADGFMHLTLTDADVRREAGAVYGEYRKGSSSPDQKLYETLWDTAFDVHTYGHDTIGWEADIQAMPTAYEYAMAFHSKLYRPENARVLVVGDVKPDVVFAEIEKDFAPWQKGTEARPVIPVEPPQKGLRTANVDWPSPTGAKLALGWKVPGNVPSDGDNAALALLAEMLFADTGALHKRLVTDDKLVYEVSGSGNWFVDPGLFMANATLKETADLARVRDAIKEEAVKFGAFSDAALLDRTRERMRNLKLLEIDDPDETANALGFLMRRGGTDAWNTWDASLRKVTPADVARVCQQYLVDDGLTVITLTPPPEPAVVPAGSGQ
jgi:zinc protease